MKKLSRSSELLWLLGTVFVALGVAICSKADLGVSMIAAPAFVLSEALLPLHRFFSVGVTEYLVQGVLLLLLCPVVRRFNWQYLLAFLVAVIYGYALNLFLWALGGVEFHAVWLRWVMLLVGDALVAFGVAAFFRTYLPLQVYELFVAEIADRFRLKISAVKWGFDLSLLAVSIALALCLFGDASSLDLKTVTVSSFHSIGLGTLVTTAINSPLISLWGRVIDRFFDASPASSRLAGFLKRK